MYWLCRFPETTMPAKVVYRLIKDARELDATPRWAKMCRMCTNAGTCRKMVLFCLCAAVPMSPSVEHVFVICEVAKHSDVWLCRLNLASFVTTW